MNDGLSDEMLVVVSCTRSVPGTRYGYAYHVPGTVVPGIIPYLSLVTTGQTSRQSPHLPVHDSQV